MAVRGKDNFRWLSGMVTNMVKDLPSGGGAWNLVLNAQGRIQGDLTIWRQGDELEIEVTADQIEKLLAHLDHFIIMDDVELVPVRGETAIGLSGPKAAEVLGRLDLPVLPEPMTEARADWNGAPVVLRRGYGVLADHYEMWVTSAQAGELWQALGAAGATRAGSAALELSALPRAFPPTVSICWSGTCRRRHRSSARCTSTRAATWGRRLSSASGRAATCIATCAR